MTLLGAVPPCASFRRPGGSHTAGGPRADEIARWTKRHTPQRVWTARRIDMTVDRVKHGPHHTTLRPPSERSRFHIRMRPFACNTPPCRQRSGHHLERMDVMRTGLPRLCRMPQRCNPDEHPEDLGGLDAARSTSSRTPHVLRGRTPQYTTNPSHHGRVTHRAGGSVQNSGFQFQRSAGFGDARAAASPLGVVRGRMDVVHTSPRFVPLPPCVCVVARWLGHLMDRMSRRTMAWAARHTPVRAD